ncbi:TIGR03086 family metal-binding protein [Nocardia stercoris]|uniref:TIGR03086 family protein n=1 Tax=Nocardia stercoris TaxID=2483361 RepID=A0A3M2LDP4_9NOCA|nr:TIGR03086 family metal-binding protein [Nocardia stercoris]RMI32818.1 TIGR03086 family protein [Nocardia stercoris]
MLDIRELDRRAVEYSVELVARLTPADLDLPTPCAAWNLRDLLAHMIAQHHGFAAAAHGRGGDPDVWLTHPLTDPITDYAASAREVLAAFAAPDAADRDFDLAELGFTIPGRLAIGFHFIDYVVHGWDVAATLGLPFHLDPELARPALDLALAVPGGDYRRTPGASFAPELPTDSDDTLDRILTTLGRDPEHPLATRVHP